MPTQTQPAPGTNSPVDPTALNLARAIRTVESGDNPNAKGASGEYGIGQWMPGNFEAAATKYGLDPNDKSQGNQEHVLYNQVEEQLKAGHSQSQVASWWNSGKYDPTGNVGVNKEGVKYDTPAYVEKVKQAYLQASQGQTTQSPASSVAPPTPPGQAQTQQPSQTSFGGALQPPTPPQASTQTPGADTKPQETFTGDLASGNYGGAALKGAENVGDFLFPVASDISSALQGKGNGKTGLQVAADTGLSALSVIPGLGELGKGAEAGIDAAKAAPGLLKLAGKGAAYGAAAGGLNSVGQGNTDVGTIAKQGVEGGLIGAATGGVGYGLGGLLNKLGIKSATLAVRPSASDFADGYDSKFAVDNGLTGNAQQIADKTKGFMSTLTAQLKSKLGNSNAGIDLASVFDKTQSELTSQKGKESNFLQNSNLQSALEKLQNEVLSVNPSGELPLLGAQTIKQQTGMYGEWLNGAPDPDANAMSTVANTFYRNLKSEIESKFPTGEISDINAQLQKAIPIMRAAIRRIPVNARSSALSLTDMLGALGFSTNPATLALPAFQHAMNSGLMSKIAPTASGLISKSAPTASALAPRAVSGLLGN